MKIINVKTPGYILGKREELVSVEVLIEGNRIKELAEKVAESKQSKLVIDGKGKTLLPGLVDPQVHFREPGLEYKEDIASGSRAANRGGFTTVVSMPNTKPAADHFDVVKMMSDKSAEVGLCRVYPTGALSFNLAGEKVTDFKALKEAGAVAITDDGIGVQKDDIFLQALTLAYENDLAVLDHSEDFRLSAGGAIHKGHISKKYKVKGIDPDSEAVHVERGCKMSLKTGAHYHVLHVSTKRSLEAVKKAKEAGARVTVEVSPHHLLLCDEDIPEREDGSLNANFKMNPPLRSLEDRLACVAALKSGLIDAIATDHAPHAPHEKDQPIEQAPFGIIGLESAFPLIYTYFVKTGEISLEKAVKLMSEQAADLFKLPHGRLAVGELADLTLVDLDEKFEFSEQDIGSKSKNSPFLGRELYGRVHLTVMDGRVVYER